MKTIRHTTRTSILIFLLLGTGFIESLHAQNGWEQMPAMPTSRGVFKTVTHNGKIYVIGGIATVRPPYEMCNEVYDIETGEWSVLASMDEPRSGLTVEIISNKIYVIGGVQSTKQTYSDIREYDIETDTWTIKCTMPEPRFNHISEVIDGKIYISGGFTVDNEGNHPGTKSSHVYDPANDHWDTIADLNYERVFGRSCVFEDKIYLFGGAPTGLPFPLAYKSIEIYDPVADVWILADDEIPVPFMTGTVLAYGNYILLLGGAEKIFAKNSYNSIYKFVPGSQDDRWEDMAPMPVDRGLMSGNILDNNLYLIGGYDSISNSEFSIAQDNHWRLNLDSLKKIKY
jgi:N-acetylneuraminic acid mutarotase